jgi:hypothetical protein
MFSRIVFDGGWSTWLSAAPPGVPDEKRRAR